MLLPCCVISTNEIPEDRYEYWPKHVTAVKTTSLLCVGLFICSSSGHLSQLFVARIVQHFVQSQ
jgi:hypothetical protein